MKELNVLCIAFVVSELAVSYLRFLIRLFPFSVKADRINEYHDCIGIKTLDNFLDHVICMLVDPAVDLANCFFVEVLSYVFCIECVLDIFDVFEINRIAEDCLVAPYGIGT